MLLQTTIFRQLASRAKTCECKSLILRHREEVDTSHSKRLLALAAQKFVADIAQDAYQISKVRATNPSAATAGGAPIVPRGRYGKDRARTVLTLDDLGNNICEQYAMVMLTIFTISSQCARSRRQPEAARVPQMSLCNKGYGPGSTTGRSLHQRPTRQLDSRTQSISIMTRF